MHVSANTRTRAPNACETVGMGGGGGVGGGGGRVKQDMLGITQSTKSVT